MRIIYSIVFILCFGYVAKAQGPMDNGDGVLSAEKGTGINKEDPVNKAGATYKIVKDKAAHIKDSIEALTQQLKKLQNKTGKFRKQVESKSGRYLSQIDSRTQKVLSRLCKWEEKIGKIISKVAPNEYKTLFSPTANSFHRLLEKYRNNELIEGYKSITGTYTESLKNSIKFLESAKGKAVESGASTLKPAEDILAGVDSAEYISALLKKEISARKDELTAAALKYLKKCRWLKNINKEAYYYAEYLQEYKSIFSDPTKLESLIISGLNKIPAFHEFSASLGNGGNPPGGIDVQSILGLNSLSGNIPIVNGIPSRAQLQQVLPASMNTQAIAQALQNNIPDLTVLNPLEQLKAKLLQKDQPGIEDRFNKFRPNSQKTKSFGKRLEKGFDIQFQNVQKYLPSTATIGATLGYKINDRLTSGAGITYKLGIGTSWQNIRLSHEGFGIKTFAKWSLKKGFSAYAGMEWNYFSAFSKLSDLKGSPNWKSDKLIGISKQLAAKGKLKSKIDVLYNLNQKENRGFTGPVVIRMGYNL